MIRGKGGFLLFLAFIIADDPSLRPRSAFCITVIIMVIAQIDHGDGGPTLLAKRCRQQAEHMGRSASSLSILVVELTISEGDSLLTCIGGRNRSSNV
jgi:hypothetical protein